MKSLDLVVNNFFIDYRSSFLTDMMSYFSSLFDFSDYLVFTIACAFLIIILKKGFKASLFFILTILSSTILVYFLKKYFDIDRPDGSIASAFGQSFPSYHATISTIFFLIIAYLFKNYFKGFKRGVFVGLCWVFIILVCFSRIYLGVHWFSDVLAGIVLGIFVYFISLYSYKNITKL